MGWKIYPVFLGKTTVDKSAFIYRNPIGEIIEDSFGCFVLKNGDDVVLFDSGIPSQSEIHRIGLTFGYMDNAPDPIESIEKVAGVKAEEIKTIVLSHLHWDHAWNLGKFSNAQIYVQREEMRYAIAPHEHGRAAYTLSQHVEGCPDWLKAIDRIIPLDGDTEICPGLKAITTPGHTPGSQSLLVETAAGLYALVSDFALCYENYTDCRPIAIFTSADDWYNSYRKIKKLAPIILPTHEVSVFDQTCYG